MEKKNKDKNNKEANMPLGGHLRELRNRIAVCIVFLVIAFLAALYFSQDIVRFLTGLGTGYGYKFVYIAPQELLMQQFTVSLIAGLCVCAPVIFYQIWAFIRPGLTKRENILFVAALLSGLIFFVVGIFFAYRVMLPFMLHFLIQISTGSDISASISVEKYINFLLTIFLIFGFIFELPVISILLTQMGLLKVEWMKKATRIVIVVIFLISAIVTPPDIISQIMVAVPMIALYELSIYLSAFLLRLRRRRHKKETDDKNESPSAGIK